MMKYLRLFSFIAFCCAVSFHVSSQLTIDGKRPVYDANTNTYLLTLPDSVFGGSFTATAVVDDTVSWVVINSVQVSNSVTFPMVSGDTSYKMYFVTGNKLNSAFLRFTYLPIVQLHGEFNADYSLGSVTMTMPEEQSIREYNVRIKWAGGTTLGDDIHKHNYHLKFVDENGLKKDVSFFGLRKDNHWRLDAGIVDMLRFRNKAAHSLWADFGNKPYYAEDEPNARNYARGSHVEVFLNDGYMGFFDLTEFLDRKQMKLKKYDEDAQQFHGAMWKTKDGTPETLFSRWTNYDNYQENWAGFEVMYPDFDEVCPTNFNVISNAVRFVVSADNSTFRNHVAEYFDWPILVDYYVFIHTLFAIDNTSKNIIWGCYDQAVDKILTLSVWDLEATCGQHWRDNDGFYRAPEIQPENELDSITPRFCLLSRSKLFMSLKDLPEFKLQTVNRYWELRRTVLDPDSLIARYEAIYNRLDAAGALDRESERWSGDDDIANRPMDFEDEFSYLCDWIRRRIAYMDTHTFACLRGDVNNDGLINMTDLVLIISYLLYDNDTINLINADVEFDGVVNINDVTKLISILLEQ